MTSAPSARVPLAVDPRQARAQLLTLLEESLWSEQRDAVVIAVHEAFTNADLHGGGVREANAFVNATECTVEIADLSGGYDPAPYLATEPDPLAERGRGLWLMNEIAHRVEFRRESDGSRVVLRFTTHPPVPAAEPRRQRRPPLPSLLEASVEVLVTLGAAVAIVDAELTVREATGSYTRLFGLTPENLIGRDVRGVIADMKPYFNDPAGFEDRVLGRYGDPDDVVEHMFLLADGRLVRRHSVALRDDQGMLIGWVNAYVPVAEQTQLVATMQQSLLPPTPQWPALDAAALYHPAQEGAFVGGDFYDFLELESGSRCVIVGDVSGRGTTAAASSMRVRAYLRAALSAHGVTAAVNDLEATLRAEFAEEEFVTLAMCVQESREMWTVTNCGHVPAMLLRDGEVWEFPAHGPLLGLGVDGPWPRQPFRMRPGDVLLLYTDGVVEAGRGRERFGHERLHDAFREVGTLPAASLVDALDQRVHAFAANLINDDHVLLAVRQL